VKSIHFICEHQGIGWRNLHRDSDGTYRSGYWDISREDAENLVGGWLYLHERKSEASAFGGKILEFEVVQREELAHAKRVVLRLEVHGDAKDQKWRGNTHNMAWTGGVVEAVLPHEVA
jgi:hypothetical protein